MMKIKKLTCIMAILMSLFLFTSCLWSGNPETAKWEEYSDRAFLDALEKAIDNMIVESDSYGIAHWQHDVSWEEGWDMSDNLDEDDLPRGKKAITYIAETSVEEDGLLEESEVYIFMELDKRKNTLRVRGATTCTDNEWWEELNRKEAENLLENLLEEFL